MAFWVVSMLIVALVALLALTGHGDGAVALAVVGAGAALALHRRAPASG